MRWDSCLERFTPTPEQLHDALEDVAYEIEQVLGICAWLIQLSQVRRDEQATTQQAILEENVYLECFLLHFRLLLDFFEKTKRARGKQRELEDALAVDYGFAAKEIAVEPGLRERINQEIAHLSYARIRQRGPAKNWYPADMALLLLARCDDFAAHLLAQPEPVVTAVDRVRFTSIRRMIHNVSTGGEA